MKTKVKMMMTILATLVLAGCEKEKTPEEPESPYMNLILVSENPLTKTQMNDAGDNILWSSDEIVNIYADEEAIPGMNVSSVLEDGKLKVTLKHISSKTSIIDGFAGAEMKADAQVIEDGKVRSFGIKLPEEQTVTLSSYDPKADALVMSTKSLDDVNCKEPVNVVWKRLNAITKFTFTGWSKDFSKDIVSSIRVSTENTPLAGCFTYDFINNKFKADPAIFNEGTESNSIFLKYSDSPSLNADFAAWMISAAAELTSGDILTITIDTDKHTFVKTINVNESVKFDNAKLNKFPLDMADAKVTSKKPNPTWTETFDNAKDNNTQFVDERWIVKDYLGWGRFCWEWAEDQVGENDELIKSHNGILIHYYGTVWHLDAYVMIKEPFDISALTLKEFCYTWGHGNTEIQTNGTDTSYERKYDFAKFEVVASTDFVDNPFGATWTVLHDGTTTVAPEAYEFPDAHEETVSLISLANEKRVYLGFRYTGGNAAYRIDNVKIY